MPPPSPLLPTPSLPLPPLDACCIIFFSFALACAIAICSLSDIALSGPMASLPPIGFASKLPFAFPFIVRRPIESTAELLLCCPPPNPPPPLGTALATIFATTFLMTVGFFIFLAAAFSFRFFIGLLVLVVFFCLFSGGRCGTCSCMFFPSPGPALPGKSFSVITPFLLNNDLSLASRFRAIIISW